MREKARDREREVIGEVADQHRVAKQAFRCGAAGGSHVGHEDLMLRIALAQRCDEWRGSARLTHRYRVQPDDWPLRRGGVAAKALAQVARVGRLLERAPEPTQPGE